MKPLIIALLLSTPAMAGDFHDGAAVILATNRACEEKVFSDEEVGAAIFLAAAEVEQDVDTTVVTVAADAVVLLRDAGNNQIFCIISREIAGR